jgi:hypothetical protein
MIMTDEEDDEDDEEETTGSGSFGMIPEGPARDKVAIT